MDNKLSIHLGEEKTKSILFSGGHRPKRDNLDIAYGENTIRQHRLVTYLRCKLDEKNTGESMALDVIKKINARLKFLCRKHKLYLQV